MRFGLKEIKEFLKINFQLGGEQLHAVKIKSSY